MRRGLYPLLTCAAKEMWRGKTACAQAFHLACLCFQVCRCCNNGAAGEPVLEHRMQHPLLPVDATCRRKRLPCSTSGILAGKVWQYPADWELLLLEDCSTKSAGRAAGTLKSGPP